MQDAPTRFRTAVKRGDVDAAADLLAPDVRMYSPVKFAPIEGQAAVRSLLHILLRTFADFRYVGELHGTADLTSTGFANTGGSHILIFRARIGDKQIHGLDLLQLNPEGQIQELTVMVRPQSALTALNEAVSAALLQ